MKKVVIVESPSKAKSLGQYLGKGYKVFASYGHVRDLIPKVGSVDPKNDFLLHWEVSSKAKKHLDRIQEEIQNCDSIILATDLDREGEAISWHLKEYFQNDIDTKNIHIERISFNSITKESVLQAMKSPREINIDLVNAYLARLSLDFLVGFTLSPILWRKLPGCKSAGRVQSVALKIITNREIEIESFDSAEYWSIDAIFNHSKVDFEAKLYSYNDTKLEKMSINNAEEAHNIKESLLNKEYNVTKVEKNRVKRYPPEPFITSTLQQDSSKRLGFNPKKTMMLAQKLYEGISIDGELIGLITYMRTDSVHIEESFINTCREHIKTIGMDYLPNKKRTYVNKSKNSQEAHEAIRPTSINRTPAEIAHLLDDDHAKLYELIWNRTLASQMADAKIDQTSLDISCDIGIFRATGSVVIFDGFLSIYGNINTDEKKSDDKKSDKKVNLPDMKLYDKVITNDIKDNQHFTQPPARYSEASLIKKMEELGIGRPSTYAYIIQILLDRKYAKLEKKKLVPEERGIIVSLFLEHFFTKYVDYGFTSSLEEQLDEVSSGQKQWKKVLHEFWDPFIEKINETNKISILDVIAYIEKERLKTVPAQKLLCPVCTQNKVSLRISKFGPFLSCSTYPECKYTSNIESVKDGEIENITVDENRFLGNDPITDAEIFIKKGPYGWYLQWQESKIKNITIPEKLFNKDNITLEQAMWMKKLPICLGEHSEGGEVLVGIGKFGPYVKYDNKFYSVKSDPTILSLSQAEDIIKMKLKK